MTLRAASDVPQSAVITTALGICLQEFNEYRSQCGMLWSYDWVSIPLVYTQVHRGGACRLQAAG